MPDIKLPLFVTHANMVGLSLLARAHIRILILLPSVLKHGTTDVGTDLVYPSVHRG